MTRNKNHHEEPPPETPEAGQEQAAGPGPEAGPAGTAETAPGAEGAPGDAAAIRRERDDLLARLQRVSADYLNYQKRARRDTETAREFANEQIIKSLLPVLDDMDRALEAARRNHAEDDPLLKGMQLVHDKAMETLGRFGLSVIEAAGKPFDPEVHAAMMQQPSDEHPPQTVLKELIRGYRLKGRTARPSGVVVSTRPEAGGRAPQTPEATPPGPPDQDAKGPE